MITISVQGKSFFITDTATKTSIALRNSKDTGFELHQKIEGRDGKDAMAVQQTIAKMVKGMNSRSGYEQRFTKVANMLKKCQDVHSFKTLMNRINTLAQETVG